MHKKIHLGYLEAKTKTSMKPLTAEVFDELINSEKVRNLMAAIRAEPDYEKKNVPKQQLPVILFACQMPDNGERPTAKNNLIVPSGFCMHDWDHMTNPPGQFYLEKILGREKEYGILLAHITPRGDGLRLVTYLPESESIPQCQERVAKMFGMQVCNDHSVKDYTRISFVVDSEYLLYINKEELFEHEVFCPTLPNTVEPAKPNTVEVAPPIVNNEEEKIAESLTYEGIKYSKIIEALINRLASNGEVKEGERNTVLYDLVRELRHICNYNFRTVYMLVAPYFPTLPDSEIRRTINSAIAATGRTITPTMHGVLNELKNETPDLVVDNSLPELPKMPKLSAIEEMILSHYPKHLRSQVFMAMLPIWGVYGTHIRFDYMDGRENSLSFMTAVVGKSGSGKAFAAHLFDQMTTRFRLEDAEERLKADQFLAKCNKLPDNQEKPDDPNPKVRLYSDDITTWMLFDYLLNLGGEHGLQFTEEVSRLVKAKRTGYGDNDDILCKAFDNAVGGKESKSKQTRNIRIPIYLNTLYCGTPGAMHKFYSNPEGGLNNRIIYAFMPNVRLKGFPTYTKFTKEEQAQFDEVSNFLWQAGTDGVKVQLPWLEKCLSKIKSKWDKEDDENPNDVLYDLGKRAMVVAMRVGVLQYYLRHCPTDEKELNEICKIVRWMAEAMRQNVYAFSGADYEKINEADNALQQQQNRLGKNKKLFSLLNDEFTVQELIALRVKNGSNSDVTMVIYRWVKDGLIVKVGDGRYKKNSL